MNSLYAKTSQSIIENQEILAKTSVDQQYALQASFWKTYNPTGYEKSIRDSGYHFLYLAESLAAANSVLFLDYVAWAKVLFAGLKFPANTMTTTLKCMGQALDKTLQPDLAVVAHSYINAALEHLSVMPSNVASYLSPDLPLFTLATNYFKALLAGDRHLGSELILDAVAHGIGVKEIYLYVFQPCQQEIGRLWQMNQVSIAQEHFCTIATQMVMSQLYPYIFNTKKINRRLVATSVSGELHEIGLRMVADFLEMEGWDTYYLGANMPPESILETIEEHKADVVAISATISYHISKVAELISQIRASSCCPAVKILAGGYPFNIDKDLWQKVGADGTAVNAQQAISVANHFVEEYK